MNARDPHAVDDLIQNLYLSMMNRTARAGASTEDVRDPRRYLFRMAWNVLHSENRRRRAELARKVSCDAGDLEMLADRSNLLWVEDDTGYRAQRAELDRALGSLPRACQIAVLRQYRDNKSYKEIAAELGVTTHTVKKYITRALQHFRVQLDVRSLGLSQAGDLS